MVRPENELYSAPRNMVLRGFFIFLVVPLVLPHHEGEMDG